MKSPPRKCEALCWSGTPATGSLGFAFEAVSSYSGQSPKSVSQCWGSGIKESNRKNVLDLLGLREEELNQFTEEELNLLI